ncbi:MAG: acyl carrier protein [Zoogloeaceae bacterium]|jgi:acyl carrier protein|nr:acyl carrier protein [Zoogloeaceae bacterium]
MMNDQALFEGVCECIRTTLGKDLPDIRESDRFVTELGADSLDFLDLIFSLEQKFNVSVNPRDLERRVQERLGEKPMLVDECYTAEAVAAFREAMPEVPEEELFPDMPARQLPLCFRVKTFMNLIAYARHHGENK